MKFDKNQRYLEQDKTGRIYIWTKEQAEKVSMREFFPDFSDAKQTEKTPAIETIEKQLKPLEDGRVTFDFLMTQNKRRLQDYALKVYSHKVSKSKSLQNMASEILELQKLSDIKESNEIEVVEEV